MTQAATKQQPVVISTRAFRQGYAHGLKGDMRLPNQPTEQAIVSVFRRVLAIDREDGEITNEQLAYEAGLLTGYLLRTTG